jgi:hypothetical protein
LKDPARGLRIDRRRRGSVARGWPGGARHVGHFGSLRGD